MDHIFVLMTTNPDSTVKTKGEMYLKKNKNKLSSNTVIAHLHNSVSSKNVKGDKKEILLKLMLNSQVSWLSEV